MLSSPETEETDISKFFQENYTYHTHITLLGLPPCL